MAGTTTRTITDISTTEGTSNNDSLTLEPQIQDERRKKRGEEGKERNEEVGNAPEVIYHI